MKTWRKLLALVMAVVMIGTLPIGSISVTAADDGPGVETIDLKNTYVGYGFNAFEADIVNPLSGIGVNKIVDVSTITGEKTELYTRDSVYLSASTKSELAESFDATFNVGAKLGIPISSVKIGMEAKFSTTNASKKSNIASELWELYYSRLNIANIKATNWDSIENLKENHLTPNFKARLAEIEDIILNGGNADDEIDALFEDYGTHLIMSYYTGGTLEISNHVFSETQTTESALKNSSSLVLSLGVGDVGFEANTGYDDEIVEKAIESKENEDRRIKVYGGQYSNPSVLSQPAYEAWQGSLEENETVVDLDYANFPAIWELADGAVATAIEARFNGVTTEHTINGYVYKAKNVEDYTYIDYNDGECAEENLYVAPGSTIYLSTTSDETVVSVDDNDYATIIDKNTGVIKVNTDVLSGEKFTVNVFNDVVYFGSITFTIKDEGLKANDGTVYFSGGYGTEKRPYLIANAKDLNNIRYYPEEKYKLVSDIDMNVDNKTITESVADGIENVYNYCPPYDFKGVLDGNGHTVKNIKIHKYVGSDYGDTIENTWFRAGLVGINSGTIKNIVIDNMYMYNYVKQANVNSIATGCVSGSNRTVATIENVIVKNSEIYAESIYKNNITRSVEVGGVCGVSYGTIKKAGVYNNKKIGGICEIKGEGGDMEFVAYTSVGGIVGWIKDSGTIEDCFVYNNQNMSSEAYCEYYWTDGWLGIGAGGWSGAAIAKIGGISAGIADGGVEGGGNPIKRCVVANNSIEEPIADNRDPGVVFDSRLRTKKDVFLGENKKLEDCYECESSIEEINNLLFDNASLKNTYESAGWIKEAGKAPRFAKQDAQTPNLDIVSNVGITDVSLLDLPVLEYHIVGYHDAETWVQDTEFTSLKADSEYKIYARLKESGTHKAGNNILFEITTNKEAAPETPQAQTVTENSVTLKATEGCEYRINVEPWQDSNVFTNLSADTEYTFYQRIKETDDTSASEISEPLVIKTKKIVTAKMTVSDITVMPGGECQIKVSVEENPGIAGLKVRINFDNTVLVPVIIEKGSVLTSGTLTTNLDQGGDLSALSYVTAFWSNPSNVTLDGDVLIVTFKANENAESGTYPITVSYEEGDITDQSYNDVDFNIINGSVEITDVVKGDIFKDGKVNTKDSVKLNQYLADWDIEFTNYEEAAADVFTDGKINTKDSVKLSQYLADWDVELMELFEIGSITFEASEQEIVDGYVDMPVTITENGGVAGFKLKLNYDNTLLTPVSVTKGDALASGTMTSNIDQGGDLSNLKAVSVFWSNPSNVVNTGVAFTVRFKVEDGVEEAVPVTLSYEEGDICDQSFNDLTVTLKDGSVVTEKTMDYTVTSLAGVVVGGSFYAEAEVVKNTDRDAVDTIVIAVYKDDVLVDKIYMRSKFANGQRAVFGGFLTGLEGATLKAFVWDSMTSMNTLSNVVEK